MHMLLMSGFGPYSASYNALEGTLFDAEISEHARTSYAQWLGRPFDLKQLHYQTEAGSHALLRPVGEGQPHLSGAVVRTILEQAGIEHELYDLEDLWFGRGEPKGDRFDVVGLSTTFICDPRTLAQAIGWIDERYPEATVILGGQYSNLKFATIMTQFPQVDYIVRGDAERALPRLLDALLSDKDPSAIPNLVGRNAVGNTVATPIEYVPLDDCSPPAFSGKQTVVPYESMRGCPFSCKFCSYPSASPKWRYKSADRILGDWRGYAERNGTEVVRSLDSTFTVPKQRFRELLQRLPDLGLNWEAYARANAIDTRETVEQLEHARCQRLFIGFESMHDPTLKKMDKLVRADHNVRAMEFLADSNIELRGGFIVGYPGETPEDFEVTSRFLVDHFNGRFGLHLFTLVDETMPVWEQADEFQIEAKTPLEWSHSGMDSGRARALREQTLHEVRWRNDDAVCGVWQLDHQRPLVPSLDTRTNLRIEKALERLAWLQKDYGESADTSQRCRSLVDELASFGVVQMSCETDNLAASPG